MWEKNYIILKSFWFTPGLPARLFKLSMTSDHSRLTETPWESGLYLIQDLIESDNARERKFSCRYFCTHFLIYLQKEGDTMQQRYAYGYVRVSTHDQEEVSPDSQKKLLREYAKKNDIIILKIFYELGVSGRKADKRPEFQKMISLCKTDEHPVDLILVWKFSRFAINQ